MNRTSVESRRSLAVVASVAITLAACAHEAPLQSTRTTRHAVASLRVGMTEQEVTSRLGEPVTRLAPPHDSGERVFSRYSEMGGWRLASRQRRFFRTGFRLSVEFRSGRLSEAWLSDPEKGVCACVAGRCAPDWAAKCS